MMEIVRLIYEYAYIGISPDKNLLDTANLLGKTLDIEFVKDKMGSFEELPAYIAEDAIKKYALLGIPDEGSCLHEQAMDYFELQVHSKYRSSDEEKKYFP
jgi:hypothetical protein